MAYDTILLEVKDQVATITLNRPQRLNAWTGRMAAELGDAMAACNENDDVRAVVSPSTAWWPVWVSVVLPSRLRSDRRWRT